LTAVSTNNSPTQQMFQVVTPNSNFNDFWGLKIIRPPESAKQVLSQTHLMQLIKGFISCARCAWARTHEISEL